MNMVVKSLAGSFQYYQEAPWSGRSVSRKGWSLGPASHISAVKQAEKTRPPIQALYADIELNFSGASEPDSFTSIDLRNSWRRVLPYRI
jgi:hypothetical protein